MSSPQHPTGSGPQPWQDQPPQYPGPNAQPSGSQGPAADSGPGPFGSAPGPVYGSAPGPHGAGPGRNAPAPGPQGAAPGQHGSAPGPYGSAPRPSHGSAPGPYGSAPGPYGSAPGPYGSGPGPYGSAPGPYGSAPGQFGGPPQPKQRSGPGLIGPLTLRDLFLLFAGLLAFIALFVPYRGYGFESYSVWHWNVGDMGALVFNLLAILVIVAAVLVNKLGSGRMRVGSLGLDQCISVLSAIAFTYAFIDLLTSAVYWHVGSYLAFFAALIAFFAGVFTMIPFFASEFAGREEIPAHVKARPVTTRSPHPAPVAHVPGAHPGGPAFGAPYGSAPAGAGQPRQPGPAGPGQYGSVGPGQTAPGHPAPGHPAPGHAGPAGPGQSGPADPGHFGQPGSGSPEASGSPERQTPDSQFGRSADSDLNSPYAPPAEHAQSEQDQTVHSTGAGQTYLGARDSEAPKHSQSEPTQAFGFGGDRGPSSADASEEASTAKFGAAAAGAGIAGAGAVAAAAPSDSESRRGRHAAPASESASEAPSSVTGEPETSTPASEPVDDEPTVVSPAESDDLVSKVNSKTSATNPHASEGAALDSEAHAEETAASSDPNERADSAAAREDDDEEAVKGADSPNEGASVTDRSAAQPSARSERTTAAESEEPTQYVPVASYGRPSDSRTDEDTVAQTAIDGTAVPNSAGRDSRPDGGQPIVQAFWFAVPEPREAVDPTTGMPVFTIYPGDWYLSLEDNGSWFKVRDTDGREGILRDIEGIQRG